MVNYDDMIYLFGNIVNKVDDGVETYDRVFKTSERYEPVDGFQKKPV